MMRHPRITSLAIGLLMLCAGVVRAAPPDMANGNANKTWVYRRNAAEPNKIGAICTYLHIEDATDANGPKVKGTLKIWTTQAGGLYGTPKTWDLPATPIKQSGTPTRKHESCRWDGTMMTPLPIPTNGNTDQIKVYASLFKGTNKGPKHEHRRAVLRCFPLTRVGKDNPPPMGTWGCEEEPDDDVLQEENNPTDPPPYDDP